MLFLYPCLTNLILNAFHWLNWRNYLMIMPFAELSKTVGVVA